MISVIVPIYNSEKYLTKCIESIISQTYKDLDIILVNDGSTDNSGKICDEFAKVDDRVRVIHQENRGLSSARNVGLKNALGEYITFVDSDDYIDNDTYEKVFWAIENFKSDLIFYREKSVNEAGKTIYINGPTPTGEIFQITKDAAAELIIGRLINGMCDKVYKASVLEGIFFKEGYMYGEDFMYNLLALSKIEKVSYVDQIKYSYVSNNASVTHKSFNKNSFDQVYFKDEVTKYVGEHFPKYLSICEKRSFLARLRICRPIYLEKLQDKYKKELGEFDFYMSDKFNVIRKQLSLLEKMEYNLYANFKPLYKVFVKTVNKLRK